MCVFEVVFVLISPLQICYGPLRAGGVYNRALQVAPGRVRPHDLWRNRREIAGAAKDPEAKLMQAA
jgi:hypothetical protein